MPSAEVIVAVNRTLLYKDCLPVKSLIKLIAMSSSSSVPMPELPRTNEGKRICQVIKVKPEALDEYKKVRDPASPDITS